MGALVCEFKASVEFASRSKSTKREYLRYLDLILDAFGDWTFARLQDPTNRAEFKAWRDTMSSTPRKADYAWTTLARVLSFAKDRGRITVNVCERGGRLYRPDRSELVWKDQDLRSFHLVASPKLRLAMQLAFWTGQRQGDLLKIRWSDYDGRVLRFRQKKTGARVVVPASAKLKQVLDSEPRVATTILTGVRGNTWTSDGFRTEWRKACKKAGIEGLTFHDLRGTAVTRLALSGCSTSQIAAITGHSLKDVESILDAHYLGGKIELAKQAVARFEATTGWPET
ncbi:tyrosine-type recombinase/integrase [Ciceribacter sp. L1K22]|nr:tyrosine-type recombinase/integrase [Ciceribacter sp. L1K22]